MNIQMIITRHRFVEVRTWGDIKIGLPYAACDRAPEIIDALLVDAKEKGDQRRVEDLEDMQLYLADSYTRDGRLFVHAWIAEALAEMLAKGLVAQ